MNISLSPRLQACADLVTCGDRVADIGCDHGYLGIHLLLSQKADFVICSDVREMPLQSAVRNAEKFGCNDRMAFFLSAGAKNIPRDFNVLVCAGMGADTITSILEAAPWLRSPAYRLILQCQSKTHTLRQYLSANQWNIAAERVVKDGKFLYTVMDVRYAQEITPLSPGQCYFSPALEQEHTPESAAYYRQILFSLRRAITGRGEDADTFMKEALQELEHNPNLEWMKE